MTPPPFYADLGKNARDVLSKGYYPGLLKLDVRTATKSSVNFVIGGVFNIFTQKTVASLETKYKFKEYGVTFTERWNTDNNLQTEIAVEDFCEGSRVACETTFVPKRAENEWNYDDKKLRLRGEFKSPVCAVNLESDFKSGGPLVRAGVVGGYEGCILGMASSIDGGAVQVTDVKFAAGFITKEFVVHSAASTSVLECSVYHSMRKNLETALSITWPWDKKADYAIGCRYTFSKEAVVRVKASAEAMVSVGLTEKIKDGITISLSLQVDCKDFTNGAHRAGCSLELEA